jgi:peptide/nickel transport system substrate-binding protein
MGSKAKEDFVVDMGLRRMNRREFLRNSSLVAGGLAAGGLLQACVRSGPVGGGGGGDSTLTYGNAEPPTSSNMDDAAVLGLVDFQIASLVQDRLIEFDKNMNLVPRLATRWEYVNDNTVRLELRDDVKYHNGEKFTAEDAKAAIDRVSSDPDLAQSALWAPVETTVDGSTRLSIRADPPFAPLLAVLAITSIPPASFSENPEKFEKEDIGAGPYRFVEYAANRVTLEANGNYWDGQPSINRIVFEYIQDPNARLNALLANDVDIITRCDSQQLKAVEGDDNFYVNETSPSAGIVMIYQHNNEIIANKKVRQAMMYAVDREALVEQILEGVGKPSRSIIPSPTFFYEPLSEAYPYDPDKAKALMDESGLSGKPRLSMVTSNLVPHQKEIDQRFAEYLADIGIDVNISSLEVGKFRTEYPNFDLSLNTFGSPNADPDFIFGVYAGPIGQAVFHLQDNPDIKAFKPLHERQRQLVDEAQRQEAVTEASEWLWDFQPTMEISDELWPFIVNKRVENYDRNRTFGEPLARNAKKSG